jgi:hypothetical protein
MQPPNAQRWPRQETSVVDIAHGGGDKARIARCPWLAAALRSGDFKILAAVITYHPAERCPAARLGRAA